MVTTMNRLNCSLLMLATFMFAAGESVADEKRGFAVNFGIGVSQVMDKDGTEEFKGNALGYSIGGEYRIGRNFAFGAGVFGLGAPDDDFNGENTKIEVKGGDLSMRFIMPVSDGIEFFGLVGHAWYTADLEPGGNNGPFGDTAVQFGFGMDLGSGDLAFRLAGRYFDGSKDEAGALVTAGFNYRF